MDLNAGMANAKLRFICAKKIAIMHRYTMAIVDLFCLVGNKDFGFIFNGFLILLIAVDALFQGVFNQNSPSINTGKNFPYLPGCDRNAKLFSTANRRTTRDEI